VREEVDLPAVRACSSGHCAKLWDRCGGGSRGPEAGEQGTEVNVGPVEREQSDEDAEDGGEYRAGSHRLVRSVQAMRREMEESASPMLLLLGAVEVDGCGDYIYDAGYLIDCISRVNAARSPLTCC